MPETKSLAEIINLCCAELPEGYMLTINLERGAGWVELTDDDDEDVDIVHYHPSEGGLAAGIAGALETARQHAARPDSERDQDDD